MNPHIVTVQYQLQVLDTWEDYLQKNRSLVKQAKSRQANLLLLPEYAGMEIAWLEKGPLNKQWDSLQDYIPRYLNFFANLAKEYDIYLQPGTLPVKNSQGHFHNRAYFFSPAGNYDYQDKIILTKSEVSLFASGDTLKVFETVFGKIGIMICYDSEFSPISNLLAHQHGATLLLVPSYTDTTRGFYRVHLSCRARAIEYQCYVVHACAHGKVDVCDFLDELGVGNAGIFAPADLGFPENGVLALGDDNSAMVEATLALEKLAYVRKNGEVCNFNDQSLLTEVIKNIDIQQIKL